METKYTHCKNCKRDIADLNYVIHSVHCERNIQLCNFCNEPVPRSEMEVHFADNHSMETCPLCKNDVERRLLENHKETCSKRLVCCKICELELPGDCLEEHLSNCETRTEKCPKCHQHIMLKDLVKHPDFCSKEVHSRKSVTCQFCGQNIYDDLEHVVICGARMDKCFKCNSYVKLKDFEMHLYQCKKEMHSRKSVTCQFCGQHIYNDLEHVAICGARTEKCSKCNNYVKLKDFEMHLYQCIKEESSETVCEFCGNSFPDNLLAEHVSVCGSKTEKCLKCDSYVLLKDKRSHPNVCHVSVANTHGECATCHQSIPWMEMHMHQTVCHFVSGSWSSDCTTSKLNVKQAVPITPPHQRNSGSIFSFTTSEENPDAKFQKYKHCSFCKERMPDLILPTHLEQCEQRPFQCKLCLKSMPCTDKQGHVCKEGKLSKSGKNSSYAEGKPGFFNRKENDFVTCPSCHCKFPDAKLSKHLDSCLVNKIKCKFCGLLLPKSFEVAHLQSCSLSEGEPNRKRRYHSSNSYAEARPVQSTPIRMDSLQSSFIPCPHCYLEFSEADYSEHLRCCFTDMKMCPFCGLEFPKENEKTHLQNCSLSKKAQGDADQFQTSTSKKKKNRQKKKDKKDGNEDKKGSMFPNFFGWNKKGTSPVKEHGPLPSPRFESKLPPPLLLQTLFSQFPEHGPLPSPQFESDFPPLCHFDLLPCEFCEKLFPSEKIIEHQSGCRPDIVSYPKMEEDKAIAKLPDEFQRTPQSHSILNQSARKTSPVCNRFISMSSSIRPGEFLGNNEYSSTQGVNSSETVNRPCDTDKQVNACTGALSYSSTETRKQKYNLQKDRLTDFSFGQIVGNSGPNQVNCKAVGAEREQKRGIIQITRDTIIDSDCDKNGSSISINRAIDGNPYNSIREKKDNFPSKIDCSKSVLNIPVSEEKTGFEVLNKTGPGEASSQGENQLFNYDKNETFDSNKSASAVWGKLETEANAKNEETFGSDSLSTKVEKLHLEGEIPSDTEETFFDAEDWKNASGEVKDENFKVSNLKEEDISNSLNENCDLDACFEFLKNNSEGLATSEDIQNANSLTKISNLGTNCECGNEICYCSLAKQPSSLEDNLFCPTEIDKFKGARPKNNSPPISNLELNNVNASEPIDCESLNKLRNAVVERRNNNDLACDFYNSSNKDAAVKSSSWDQWRGRRLPDTDSD